MIEAKMGLIAEKVMMVEKRIKGKKKNAMDFLTTYINNYCRGLLGWLP